MALQKLVLNGTETGATAGVKINAIIDDVNALATTLSGLGSINGDVSNVTQSLSDLTTQVSTLGQNLATLEQTLSLVSSEQGTTSADLDTLETEVTTLSASLDALGVSLSTVTTGLADVQLDVATLLDTALLVYKTSVDVVNSLTTTFTTVAMGDTVSIDKSNNHVAYNGILEVFDINTASVYSITACGAISGAASRLVSFSFFVNGVSMFPVGGEPVFECSGSTDPLHVSCHGFFDLQAGDQVQVKAKVDAASDITFHYSSISIKKEILS